MCGSCFCIPMIFLPILFMKGGCFHAFSKVFFPSQRPDAPPKAAAFILVQLFYQQHFYLMRGSIPLCCQRSAERHPRAGLVGGHPVAAKHL